MVSGSWLHSWLRRSDSTACWVQRFKQRTATRLNKLGRDPVGEVGVEQGVRQEQRGKTLFGQVGRRAEKNVATLRIDDEDGDLQKLQRIRPEGVQAIIHAREAGIIFRRVEGLVLDIGPGKVQKRI